MALTVAALVAGALVGTGLASTDVVTSDGLTWLDDGDRGTVVQVNPATGQTQAELKVGPPGNPLEIAQRDGLLVIRDPITGALTIIDVGQLVATGRRGTSTGNDTKVLLDADQLYLVDRPSGTVRRIDPATASDIGAVWAAGTALADVAIDGTGTLWALDVNGRLHTLRWSPTSRSLTESSPTRSVAGTGPRSVLVPHDAGVTVLAPEGSRVVRVGTDSDVSLPAPDLDDQVGAPTQAPADLVPASVPSSATVVIIHGDRVISIDVGPLGCQRPGSPVVYHDRVYVPCLGTGKVLVFDPNGRRLTPDISVPDGEPKIVIDDGRLIIYVPGTSEGVVVDADGSTRTIHTHDDDVPPREPVVRTPPPLPPNPTKRPPTTQPPSGNNPGVGANPGRPSGGPSSSGPVTGGPTGPSGPTVGPPTTTDAPPPPPRMDPPTNVVAQARPDGSVLVTWTPGGSADSYRVLRGDTFGEVATVPGGATSAIVTTLNPGTDVTVIIEANYGGTTVRSVASGPVRVYRNPDAPSSINIALVSAAPTQLTVQATWTAAPDNGSAITSYSVTVRTDRGFQTTLSVGGLSSGSVTVDCQGACDGIRVSASVFGINAAGDGAPVMTALDYDAPPPPVIDYLLCEYVGRSSNFCEVQLLSGSGSIRWRFRGMDLPSLNDKQYVRIACGATTGGSVEVTVSNVAGSDSERTNISLCSGPIP